MGIADEASDDLLSARVTGISVKKYDQEISIEMKLVSSESLLSRMLYLSNVPGLMN